MRYFFFIIIILLCVAFKKKPTTDYRDSYCGTYYGIFKVSYLSANMDSIKYKTYNSSVTVSKNTNDSFITISTATTSYNVKLVGSSFKSFNLLRVTGRFYDSDSLDFVSFYPKSPNRNEFKGKK